MASRNTIRFIVALTVIALQVAALPAFAQAPAAAPRLAPPIAEKRPKIDVAHGDRREDDYFWLRERENPAVKAYLEAENAFAEQTLSPTRTVQEALYTEMLSRIKETDLSVPYREESHVYYYRTEQGKQYRIYCRKRDAAGAPEEITLDLNEMAKGHPFMGLGAYEVSDDGNLLTYSTDNTGFRVYKLHVKDLRTGQVLPDTRDDVGSVAWAADNRTLFYTTKDSAKRSYRLWRHALGAPRDDLVYEEKDPMFNIHAERTRSKAFILLGSDSLTTSEVRFLPADQPTGTWKTVTPRKHEREYEVAHHGDLFYIRVNDTGRNFRLVTAPVSDTAESSWKEILPHRPDVMLEGIDLFANHYIVWERRNGLPEVRVTDLRTGASHSIAFPEPTYSVFPSNNPEWNTTVFRYSYQSLVTPPSIFDYDMDGRKSTLLKQDEVLGGYDPARYASVRLEATAGDGTMVPISVVRRKDTVLDGTAPMLLTGYGSYGFPLPVTFASDRLSLLDRGFVIALAHIRGGGEMGKTWHDRGRMMNKMNTFTDFISAAEHLTAARYTSKDRLVITGGSAGGLLMGAVTNLRPDLFKAVVTRVPFVDVINTMSDASLPLTAGEFEEWGDPRIKDQYECMKRYCPYTNIQPKAYPAMLVKTSFNDSQVMYWEPAKYVAKLRAMKTDGNPLLLVTNMGAGHGGASGRYDKLRETALDYAFMLQQVGIAK